MPMSAFERQQRARAAGLARMAKHGRNSLSKTSTDRWVTQAREQHPEADPETAAGAKVIAEAAEDLQRQHIANMTQRSLTSRRKAKEMAEKAAADAQALADELAEADDLPDAG